MASEETADEPQGTEASEQRAVLAKIIATKELPRIRQRGLDDLDLTTHNRTPVDCKFMEELSRLHSGKSHAEFTSRSPLVRNLMDDVLAAYAEHNLASATLIRELFFSPDGTTIPRSPGDLLDDARKRSGLKQSTFDRLRRKEFAKFSDFLTNFVVSNPPSPEAKRILVRVPKGYRLVHIKKRRLLWLVMGAIILGALSPIFYDMATKPFPYLEVGSGSTRTYKEPTETSAVGPILKAGQTIEPSCIVAVVQNGRTLDWVRIKSKPWNDKYYAPSTAFRKGTKTLPALRVVGVPYCLTK